MYYGDFDPNAVLKKWIVYPSARDFVAGEGLGAQEYFVYFKLTNRTDDAKDPLRGGEAFQRKRKE